ncbi:MAG: C39 family peptidase [Actinobacteria bacterium]|nr:C39 family peptidase [Actinomycetota bacterium]
MSTAGARPRPRRAVIRRRRLAALAALATAATAVGIAVANGQSAGGGEGGGATPASPPPQVVKVELGGKTLERAHVGALSAPAAQARLVSQVPAHQTVHDGKATITYAVDVGAVAAALKHVVREGGGTVVIPRHAVASTIAVPMIGQVLRDDCEATALSMVLGYAGTPVDQLTLQRQVAHAQPLDPTTGPNGEEVWGDPSLGFVGRADGGGPAGGFGVYQGPIRALAQRHGLAMTELTGTSPRRIYAALLAGHPVLAWVALSEGPYATWTSPAGRTININYGEHAVVLTGLKEGVVAVNDPLSGERITWSTSQFEQMWAGLGHRALAA